MKLLSAAAVLSILLPLAAVAETAPPPIIDVHLHALPADFFGPPRRAFCLPTVQWPAHDPRRPYAETFREWEENPTAVDPSCKAPIWSPETDDELMRKTLEILERRNVVGVTSGPRVGQWREQAGDRVIPGLMFWVRDSATG